MDIGLIKMAGNKSHTNSNEATDVFHKFACDPCAREDRNMKAYKFCWECGDNLCTMCIQLHRRFTGMARHQMSACGSKTSGGGHQACPTLTQKCKIHDRMIVDTFCVDHNAPCCGTCVSIDHRLCQEIKYLPDAARGVADTKKYQDTINRLETAVGRLEYIITERQKDTKRLDKDRNAIIRQLKVCREKFEKLEEKVMNEIQNVYNERCKIVAADTKVSESNIRNLRLLKVKLDKTDKRDEPNLFLLSKEADQALAQTDKMAGKFMKRIGTETIKFKPDLTFNLLESLGTCTMTRIPFARSVKSLSAPVRKIQPATEADLIGQYDIRDNDDEKYPEIYGVTVLPDGRLVVGDYSNSCVRVLSHSYKVVGILSLPSPPFSVCSTGPDEVCTTLVHLKTVQFVHIRPILVLSTSFQTEMPCRGITHLAGKLYVTCGGAYGEDHGQIHEYTTIGQLLRVFDEDQTGAHLLSWPVDVTADKDTGVLYVADREKGVVAVSTLTGEKWWEFSDDELQYARGVCVDKDGIVYASGRTSRNVVQISSEGAKLRVLLSDKDGLSEPCVLCFDTVNRRLLLTSYTHCMLKVYNLK